MTAKDSVHSGLSLFWSELRLASDLRLHSDLNGLLYSVSVSKDMFVDHSYPRKRVLLRVGFQESVSMQTYLSARFLKMGLHVTNCSSYKEEQY
jgi:hypothetical protein